MYNKYKSNYYKNVLKLVSKKYKTTLSKTQRMYNDKKITDIRKLKSTNPKKYWKVINTNNKKDEVQAPLEDLYNFFGNDVFSKHLFPMVSYTQNTHKIPIPSNPRSTLLPSPLPRPLQPV